MLLLLGMFYISRRLLRLRADEEPNRRRDHFLLRDHAAFFLRADHFIVTEVSSTTRQLLGYFSALEQMGTLSRGEIDTRPIVLYLSHDDRDADIDLSGLSIAQVETVTMATETATKPQKIHRFQIGLNVAGADRRCSSFWQRW